MSRSFQRHEYVVATKENAQINNAGEINAVKRKHKSAQSPGTLNTGVSWAKRILRTAGLRSTAARVAVLCKLAEANQPMSHGDAVDALREFSFDQSTIFRALNDFSDAGIVSRLDLGNQVRRYELRHHSDKEQLEHPHFMCVDCGKVTCLNDFAFQLVPIHIPPKKRPGEILEVLLRGYCRACGSSDS